MLVNFINQKFFGAIAQTQGCQRSLIQPQNRKHTPHLGEFAGDLMQRNLVAGIAEELIQRFFNFTQRGSQFVNHTAHRLTITDTSVELLHPAFKRLGLTPRNDMLQTMRQTMAPLCHLGLGRIQIGIGRFQIKDCRGHFHGHRRTRWLTRFRGSVNRVSEGTREVATLGVEL